MLGIAQALAQNGFSELITDLFISIFGNNVSPYLLLFIGSFLSISPSQFMGDSTTVGVILPPILGIASGLEFSPFPFTMAVIYGSRFAFLTPIGGATVGLTMAVGYKCNDYFWYNGLLTIIILIMIMIVIPLSFPF